MVITESIKLVLGVEQFGKSSDLSVILEDVQQVSYFHFLFLYASTLRHSMHSTEIFLSIFSL